MKRILSIGLVMAVFTLSGCGSTANVPLATDDAQATLTMQQDTAAVIPDAQSETTPDVDTAPDGSAPTRMRGEQRGTMVIGRVDKILGNEVSLTLADMEGMQIREWTPPAGQDGGAPNGVPGDMPSGTPDPNRSVIRRGDGGTPPEGMTPPDGAAPGQGRVIRDAGGTGGGAGGGASRQLDIKYTEEAATYLLPVGLAIGTGDYTSVTTGMVLRLTLNEEQEIISVSILSQ